MDNPTSHGDTGSVATAARPPGALRHKTLSAYYTHVYTLGNFIDLLREQHGVSTDSVAGPSSPSSSSRHQLRRPDDAQEYRDLLDKTICASHRCPGTDLDRLDGHRFWRTGGSQTHSSRDVIGDILQDLAQRDGDKNVLFLKERYVVDVPVNIHHRRASSSYSRSGNTAFLRSFAWRILRTRIGDDLFRRVLLDCSIFTRVENNCLVQVSGRPIHDLEVLVDTTTPSADSLKLSRPLGVKEDASLREPPRRSHRKVKNDRDVPRQMARFRKPSASPAERIIARHSIFYGQAMRRKNGKLVYGLHPKHVLNESRRCGDHNDVACVALLREIFPSTRIPIPAAVTANESGEGSAMGRKRYRDTAIMGVMKELLVRHASIQYGVLLKRFVSLARDHTAEVLSPISHQLVCRFLTAMMRAFVSTTVIGSEHNLKVIIKHSHRLVTAKQFEPLTLHTVMQGMRVDDISWLRSNTQGRVNQAEALKRRLMLEQFLFWLFNDFLVPLLKASFYVTETAETRYQTVFYDYDDWENATRPHYELLKGSLLEPLTSLQQRAAAQNPLGISAVRLIPKPKGFRPIVNLGRRAAPGSNLVRFAKKKQTANDLLKDLHHILMLEKDRTKDRLGSSLMGTNEIFAPLYNLRNELATASGDLPRLYFVKMDIKAAFDTIKQDRMMDIVSDLLDKDNDYCMIMYSLLLPPASKASSKAVRKLFKTRAVLDDGVTSFGVLSKDIADPLRNAVMVNLARRRNVTREQCLELLRLHLKNNTWQIGNELFRQREGIPQGSKISSLLCSLCYAALEKQYLAFVHQPGSRLLRYIDDFLFITSDVELAKRFIRTMSRGFSEYGAFVSPHKTLVNFEYTNGATIVPTCPVDHLGHSYFPYCGFLIDTRTLEMSMDHMRVLAGPIEQSFSLRFSRRKGSSFLGWFTRQLENRNHIAYLDTVHNDLPTVWLNVYLNFVLTGMKIPHYFSDEPTLSAHQAKIVFTSVCLAAEYSYIAGRARVEHAMRAESQPKSHYRTRKADFIYLAKRAIVSVLSRKVSQLKDVVHLFRVDLGGRENRKMKQRFERVVDTAEGMIAGASY